jgi:hypothetical protein
MILGLSIAAFTQFHVVISLIGLLSGAVLVGGWLSGRWYGRWNCIFLTTTILTSITGFMFPITVIGPPHIVGAISLAVLAVALVALYGFHRIGIWRSIYIASATLAFYLNAFVGVVQTFQKIGPFHSLAPTQTEPPFLVAQILVLLAFVGLGFAAIRRFKAG